MKFKCTNCKKIFKTEKEGMAHFEIVNHKWGGLSYIEEEGGGER